MSGDGYIVTNHHVVDGAEAVRVIFADGRIYDATVIGTDAFTDLGVLQIDAAALTPIEFGSTEDLTIGDTAIAIGSPLGLEGGPSVTRGVISAFERQVQTGPNPQTDVLFGMIQTDAPITRGSSGGALVDEQGRLIGITSAIGVSNVGAEGIGFAIPVELVKRVTDEIIADGSARHAFLGIAGTTDFEEQPDGAQIPVGVRVQSVEAGSAAADVGIEVGDRIVAVAGEPVDTMDGLIVTLRGYGVGIPVEISVLRDGQSLDIEIVLGERPAS
jgi:putative serine protease PepD